MGNECTCELVIEKLKKENMTLLSMIKEYELKSKSLESRLEDLLKNPNKIQNNSVMSLEIENLKFNIKMLNSEIEINKENLKKLRTKELNLKKELDAYRKLINNTELISSDKNLNLAICITKINEILKNFNKDFQLIQIEEENLENERRTYIIDQVTRYTAQKLFGTSLVENISNDFSKFLTVNSDMFILYIYHYLNDFNNRFESLLNFNEKIT